MEKYNVYKSRFGSGFLLDVQTDLLSGLNTRVVIPLMLASDAPKAAKYLNPTFEIDGVQLVMMTQFIASIPDSELKGSIMNLKQNHHEISSALDMLFSGF